MTIISENQTYLQQKLTLYVLQTWEHEHNYNFRVEV